MFDAKQIDDYFDGKTSIVSSETRKGAREFSWARFVKLFFPCIAAAIFGLMVVLPNIKKSTDIQDHVTFPRKSEMEKLHVEQIAFNTTDKKNRVSNVWAESMDELKAGSDEVKIKRPHADVPSDNGDIKISSDIGFMNQKTKILRLEQNVEAKDENNNTVHTSSATYDFEKEYGHGESAVWAEGDWGKLSSQGFNYDKNSAVLTLLGLTVIEAKNGILTSQTETKYFQNENKVVSVGKATAKKDNRLLEAEKIINYLSKGAKKELEKTEAFGDVKIFDSKGTIKGEYADYDMKTGLAKVSGNVKIESGKGTVKGERANYDTNTGTAEVLGNVVIISEKGTAKGERAVYDAKNNTVDLYGNVVLEQGDNFMHGQHVHTDLNTSISTITADKKQGSRVSGTFYNKRKAENGKKTD